MRVLVIEDEPLLRRQVTERLTREGFQVDASGTARKGSISRSSIRSMPPSWTWVYRGCRGSI